MTELKETVWVELEFEEALELTLRKCDHRLNILEEVTTKRIKERANGTRNTTEYH